MTESREITLEEYLDRLPKYHLARRQYELMRVALENVYTALETLPADSLGYDHILGYSYLDELKDNVKNAIKHYKK